jgi:hypothetical protein
LEKKKIVEIIGSVFVALIFLSSYASFGSRNISTGNGTTTVMPTTFPAKANGVANIIAYSPNLDLTINCQNVTRVSDEVMSFIDAQNSSAVERSFSLQASQITVVSGTLGTYSIYNSISQAMGEDANCTVFATTAQILLPVRMSFGGTLISIPNSLRSFSQQVVFSKNMSTTMNVMVDAILTLNGSIYNNNIRATRVA